jgi:hypothetical protein
MTKTKTSIVVNEVDSETFNGTIRSDSSVSPGFSYSASSQCEPASRNHNNVRRRRLGSIMRPGQRRAVIIRM